MLTKKLIEAARKQAAKPGTYQRAHLGAIAIRTDGKIVKARNGASTMPVPSLHAEARALRKADRGCVLIVVRIRPDGSLAMAKPCKDCQALIRSKRAVTYYSNEAGEIVKLHV